MSQSGPDAPLWRVALCSPHYATLTYAAPACLPPETWRAGMRALVPLGNTLRLGVLLGPQERSDLPADVALKELLWPVERAPLLDPEYMDMVAHLGLRQMAEPGRILGTVLPAGLRTAAVRFLLFEGARPRVLHPRELRTAGEPRKAELAALWTEGRMEVRRAAAGDADQEYCRVAKDPPWPVRPAARRQMEVLEYLWERGVVARRFLLKDLGPQAAPALSRLADLGLVAIGPPPGEEDGHDPACLLAEEAAGYGEGGADFCLSREQREALDALHRVLAEPEAGAGLVHGVTGSGKTVVYLELARACLEQGRSAVILAPEVALACHLRRAVQKYFPAGEVHFHHGYQSPAARERRFRELAERRDAGRPVLVVGTRSALFLPLHAPGLVVLDEEHDASFKQDEGFTYQAKEVAWFRVKQHGGLLLLGSATPDVKTFYAARQGALPCVRMQARVGSGGLPGVELVNIRDQKPTDHLLAPRSTELLQQTLKAGDQAIIMLNRRGYAPLMYCLDCDAVARCPECDIGLTYHKGRERLVCHYCGLSRPFPLVCSKCGGGNYLPMGEGTEKLEETLAASLPHDVSVLRMDRDSTRRPGRMEEIMDAFARREAQVLVGTQMLSKGHHFPGVTLVVVADADLGLNLPDYRATERTFQLLVQVSGRSGRGDKPGTVLIQTRDPKHYCWDYVLKNDYVGFFRQELALREKRRYPPFVKLALVRMSFPTAWEPGMQRVGELARAAREAGRRHGVTVLGPAPAPLAMLRGRRRFLCLLKAEEWPAVRNVYHHLSRAVPAQGELRVSLDLDPVNML